MGTIEVKDAKVFMGDVLVGTCHGGFIEGIEIEGREFKIQTIEGTMTISGFYDPTDYPDWRAFERAVFAAVSKAALGAYERWRKRMIALRRAGGRLLRKKRLQKKVRKAMEEYWREK